MFAKGIQHYSCQGMEGNEIMPVHHALNATSITKESVLQQGMTVKHSHHRVETQRIPVHHAICAFINAVELLKALHLPALLQHAGPSCDVTARRGV